jgi:hypothetical protein
MRPMLLLLFGVTLGIAGACSTAPVSEPPAAPKTLPRAATARGELLYENHCTGCHTSVVHVQTNHRATSDVEVESWVRRWSDEEQLRWTDEDVLDVTDYLLERFYSI